MTQEEKAKAYDEALERAKGIYNETWNGYILKIFPELTESEDERIRKEIYNALRYLETELSWDALGRVDILDAYAWLEKQGEQHPTSPKWKYKKDNTPLLRDSIILNKYGCVAKSPSGAIVSDVWVLDYDELAKLPKEELEKQGEQKPVDKVEPKFKVGDVVIWNGEEFTIEKVRENTYRVGGYDVPIYTQDEFTLKSPTKFKVGDWVTNSIETVQITGYDIDYGYQVDYKGNLQHRDTDIIEKEYHLWTIQDAKDGDVLWHSDTASNGIFIFKEIRYDGKVLCYCDYDSEDHFCTGEYHTCCWSNDKYIYPATKEQRELLFQKMREAGYE